MIGRGKPAFDKWSYVHLLTGILMGTEISRTTAYALAVGTEIVELVARRADIRFFDESQANVTTDLALTIGGYEIARALRDLRS